MLQCSFCWLLLNVENLQTVALFYSTIHISMTKEQIDLNLLSIKCNIITLGNVLCSNVVNVQYCRRIPSTVDNVQYCGRYHQYFGGRGIVSTVEGVQYYGGYHSALYRKLTSNALTV